MHKFGTNEAAAHGSQNFSCLALNTAELATLQISSKNLRQRRMTDGFFFSLWTHFLGLKSSKTWKFATKKIAGETKTFHISYVESKNWVYVLKTVWSWIPVTFCIKIENLEFFIRKCLSSIPMITSSCYQESKNIK
jgi:hypothetical protein